jgi:hypothetical protein
VSQATHSGRKPTPAIDKLLSRLRSRLVREVWIFGLGHTALALTLILLFAFLVDWTLHVPSGVRIVHLLMLILIPGFVLWRDLISRLRKLPDKSGLAVLVERAHPELKQVLVSAVELSNGDNIQDSEIDRELVDRVISEAEQLAPSLALRETSDPRRARTSFLLGTLGVLSAILTFGLQGDSTRIFFERIAGAGPSWPQRTYLVLEIPLAGELNSTRDELQLSVARGSDLPVVVRTEGRVPDEVTIHFDGGHEVLLGSAGRGVFRTLLRSVQEDISFHVTGGDDRDGTPNASIQVLQPPDVSTIVVQIVPPTYSGLPERLESDRDVSVLANSVVTVFMRPDPLEATGIARLLPRDEVHSLERRPFPRLGAEEEQAPEQVDGLSFELIAQESLRYRFELVDETGLSNPDPGLFGIEVQADRAPQIELLSPTRGEIESVVGGALPLKALASDDFALSRLTWRSVATSSDTEPHLEFELQETEPINPEELSGRQGDRDLIFASRRIDVDELFGTQPPTEGEVFQIDVSAADNREPSHQETRSAPVRLRIVSADEFLRRTQDHLSRVRGKVDALATLMREKQNYTRDLIASLESDEPDRADSSGINTALSGARRVEGDARALSREVASIAEALLYSRIDSRADLMLTKLERRSLKYADRSFHAEPWLELRALQLDGRLGQADFADKLVEIVGVALEISEIDAVEAINGLRRAQDLNDISAQYESLLSVSERQTKAQANVEQLLALLSEWDSYQSLLAATRDLLSRQKNLLERTRQFYKDN